MLVMCNKVHENVKCFATETQENEFTKGFGRDTLKVLGRHSPTKLGTVP